ncbi:MAG TPA: tRNA (adenosine(37)-N6)-threonylcarbamoyltransferase complex dimerization subunit type 1 TsaB [Candidatus Binatia bacterium]|nr:tRNA (adenosine(37)-N6)-threonylcarbamoyltransferase complex dimerization subunit type 1 TsaB [Candidatus Binatia bacterium]
MRIVGIDTATCLASVALIENGQILAERMDPSREPADASARKVFRSDHGATLLPLVGSLLDAACVSLNDVGGIAVSIGPGSFTGLRIGLSTVKGLAYGTALPVVGIPTLLATAARAVDYAGWVCALLDAGKKQVYARLFHKAGESLTGVTEDLLVPAEGVVEQVQTLGTEPSWLFIGNGARLYQRLLLDAFGSRAHFVFDETRPTPAAMVARLGERRLQDHGGDDLGSLVPFYVRPPDAETKSDFFL